MKNFRKSLLIATLVAVLGVAGALAGTSAAGKSAQPSAQDKPSPAEANAQQLLRLIDADHDGSISKAEWTKFMASEFDRLDADKDGTVDAAELAKSRLRVVPAASAK